MSEQQILWICVAVCLFLAGLFLTGRRAPPPPSRLYLSRESEDKGAKKSSHKHSQGALDPSTAEVGSLGEERSLNVVFMFNGHSWEAYEVLGLPAGAGKERVEAAYQKALADQDPSSREFIDAAYAALRTTWRKY